MILKRADHHCEPLATNWKDGRYGVLSYMERSEADPFHGEPIRCFVVRELLDNLQGDLRGSLLDVFHARRAYFDAVAERLFADSPTPELVLTPENYPALRARCTVVSSSG